MSTASVRSVGVATEVSFGSTDANGFPSFSGLTYYGLECDRANVAPFGDPASLDRAEGRAGFYDLPPEPVAAYSSGAAVRIRSGEITLTCTLRGVGDGSVYSTYAAIPWYMLMRSSLAHSIPGGASDAISAEADVNTHTATDASKFAIGRGFKVDLTSGTYQGRSMYQFATDIAGTTITASPGLMLRAGHTARMLQTLYYGPGATIGASTSLYLSGHEWKTYAFGCRMKSFRITSSGGPVRAEITMQCAAIIDAHGSGVHAANPARYPSPVMQMKNSLVLIGDTAIGTTVPAALSASPYSIDDMETGLDVTLVGVGQTANAIGIMDLEPVDYAASANLTLSYRDSTLTGDFFAMTQRSVLVGFGPGGTGNGGCIYLPAGTLRNDPSMHRLDSGRVQTRVEYVAGQWDLDDSTDFPARSTWRMGLSL